VSCLFFEVCPANNLLLMIFAKKVDWAIALATRDLWSGNLSAERQINAHQLLLILTNTAATKLSLN